MTNPIPGADSDATHNTVADSVQAYKKWLATLADTTFIDPYYAFVAGGRAAAKVGANVAADSNLFPIPGPIDANKLERIAKDHPSECFLTGRGVLKLIDAIRELERRITPSSDAAPSGDGNSKLFGFDRDDLDAIADGLETGYDMGIDVGGSPMEGIDINLIPSTTAAAARFIRTVLAAGAPAETPKLATERLAEKMQAMGVTIRSYSPGTDPNATAEQIAAEMLKALEQITAQPAPIAGDVEKDALDAKRYRKIKADNDDCDAETFCLFFDSKSGGLISIESKDMDTELDAAMLANSSSGEAG